MLSYIYIHPIFFSESLSHALLWQIEKIRRRIRESKSLNEKNGTFRRKEFHKINHKLTGQVILRLSINVSLENTLSLKKIIKKQQFPKIEQLLTLDSNWKNFNQSYK